MLSLSKHAHHGKRLCCDCIKQQDSSTSQSVRKSCRMKAKKCIEGSDMEQMTIDSHESLLIRSPGEGTSGKDTVGLSSIDASLDNKSSNIQIGSCSNKNSTLTFDDGYSGGRLVSQSRGMDPGKSLEVISLEPSFKRNCNSSCNNSLCLLNTSKVEATDSISKDKPPNMSGDSHKQSKSTTLFITFSRRYKRKKEIDGADTQKNLILQEKDCSLLTKWSDSAYGNNCPFEAAASHKSCSGDQLTDSKLSGEDSEMRHMFPQNIVKVRPFSFFQKASWHVT